MDTTHVNVDINLDRYKESEIMMMLAQKLITKEEFLRWKQSKPKSNDSP